MREELGGRVPLVLDGGACPVGIESTILDLSRGAPVLLRPGAIGAADLARVLGRGVRICSSTLVWDVRVCEDGGVEVRALDRDGPIAWRADKLIVATGAYERPWPVPGWTLPGAVC